MKTQDKEHLIALREQCLKIIFRIDLSTNLNLEKHLDFVIEAFNKLNKALLNDHLTILSEDQVHAIINAEKFLNILSTPLPPVTNEQTKHIKTQLIDINKKIELLCEKLPDNTHGAYLQRALLSSEHALKTEITNINIKHSMNTPNYFENWQLQYLTWRIDIIEDFLIEAHSLLPNLELIRPIARTHPLSTSSNINPQEANIEDSLHNILESAYYKYYNSDDLWHPIPNNIEEPQTTSLWQMITRSLRALWNIIATPATHPQEEGLTTYIEPLSHLKPLELIPNNAETDHTVAMVGGCGGWFFY